ncbi:MAG: BMC domain-containing protein [Lachnospiraceae bacterium]|nr:BMC domain-containing protein [Lachnospiraceae bacterium]
MAIGLLEVDGVCAAFAAIDAAEKAADIIIEALERTRGGCNVCIKIRGDISSVQTAMECAIAAAEQVSSAGVHTIIPAPADDTEYTLIYSNI